MPTGHPIKLEKAFVNEFGKTYSKVTLRTAQCALVIEWYGYTTKHQIEVVALWVETLRTQLPFYTILNDCTYIISVWEDSIEWFSRVWLVKMKRLGVMCFIHIAKPNSFGAKIGQHLNLQKHANMAYLFFDNLKDAEDWLQRHETYS